ncbi:unnamed protein product, partial [Aphanomyces euteiches]
MSEQQPVGPQVVPSSSHNDCVKAVGAVKWMSSKNFDGDNFHYWMKAIRNQLKAARLWE